MVGNRQPSIVIPFYRCGLEEWNVRGGIYKVDLSLPSISDAVSSAISFPSTTIPVVGSPGLSLGPPHPVMPQRIQGAHHSSMLVDVPWVWMSATIRLSFQSVPPFGYLTPKQTP